MNVTLHPMRIARFASKHRETSRQHLTQQVLIFLGQFGSQVNRGHDLLDVELGLWHGDILRDDKVRERRHERYDHSTRQRVDDLNNHEAVRLHLAQPWLDHDAHIASAVEERCYQDLSPHRRVCRHSHPNRLVSSWLDRDCLGIEGHRLGCLDDHHLRDVLVLDGERNTLVVAQPVCECDAVCRVVVPRTQRNVELVAQNQVERKITYH